jgi:hypothetical protein
VTAAALAAGLPGPARAAEQIASSPTLGGRLGGPGSLGIDISVTNSLGGIPAPLTTLVVDLPPGATYNFATTPVCLPVVIAAAASVAPACPTGSRIGEGTARVQAAIGTTLLDESAAMYIYLIARNPVRYDVWANGTTPVEETLSFGGTLKPAAAPYGEQIGVTIPPIPTVPGGPSASIISLQFTVGGTHTVTTTNTVRRHGRSVRESVKTSVGLFDLPRRCPASLPDATSAGFADGSTVSATGALACP